MHHGMERVTRMVTAMISDTTKIDVPSNTALYQGIGGYF